MKLEAAPQCSLVPPQAVDFLLLLQSFLSPGPVVLLQDPSGARKLGDVS